MQAPMPNGAHVCVLISDFAVKQIELTNQAYSQISYAASLLMSCLNMQHAAGQFALSMYIALT